MISGAGLFILILIGSARNGSYSRASAAAVASVLVDCGTEVLAWDPVEWPLPLAHPAFHHDPLAHPDPEVRALVEAASRADGFVFVSPVYHNSYSGLLKNCLDHLTIAQFAYKPVTIISHGSGLSAVQVCDQLRLVARGLHALALPGQLVTVPEDFTANPEGPVLSSAGSLERIGAIVSDLLFYSRVGQARLTTAARAT